MDRHIWMLSRLNKRLDLLGCAPRDMERCLRYLHTPQDELHHVLGFYGDTDEIKMLHGLKHYIVNIFNKDGLNAFRYICLDNYPHFVPPAGGELLWPFFKQFRREQATGKIICEEYKA